MKYRTLLLTFIFCTGIAQAATTACDLEFIVTPKIPVITTATCTDTSPVTKTYVIENEAPVKNTITLISLINKDSLPGNAVTVDLTAPNSCQVGEVLAPGATCDLTVSFQPCVTGNINRLLEVKGNTNQGIISKRVITSVVGSGCATVGTFDDENPLAYTSSSFGVRWSASAPIPRLSVDDELNGVACSKTSGECVAVGTFLNNTVGVLEPLSYTSLDFGATWTVSEVLPPPKTASFTHSLASVSCLTSGRCVAVGNYSNGFGRLPLVYVSDDFGVTWHEETQPPVPATTATGPIAELYGVSCNQNGTNVPYCMAVGSYLDTPSTFQYLTYFSTDAGSTWTQESIASVSTYNVLRGVYCNNNDTCMADGSFGTEFGDQAAQVFEFSSGSWTSVFASATVSGHQLILTGISCHSAFECVAMGYDQHSSNAIPLCYTNANIAVTWGACATSPAAIGTVDLLNGVACNSGGNCSTVGFNQLSVSTANPLSYYSGDSGNNWLPSNPLPQSQGSFDVLNSVSCSD